MASSLNEDKALETLLESGDTKKCMQFFKGMSEKTRREHFPVVKAFWTRISQNMFIEGPPRKFKLNPLYEIACMAYFATATGPEIIKSKRLRFPDLDIACEVLADRRPDWVDRWVESLLGESHYWVRWRLIRRLVVAGLAQKPTSPRYILGMISGLNDRFGKTNLVDELEKDPELLKEDFWKLFEHDGDGENSLANTESPSQSWIDAFLKLMQNGKLPRERLIVSCIDALERDFNHYRARWFFDFFDRLEPTEKELSSLADRLLGLLGASAPNVATWALARVETLAASSAFESPSMCHALEKVLRARAKKTVLTALKLLERQAALRPKDTSLIAATAAQALAHDAPDVQKATLKLLDSISSPKDLQVRKTVDKFQATLAPSVRSLAAKWLAAGAADSSASGTGVKIPASKQRVSAKSTELPKLSKQLESLYAIDQLRSNLKTNTPSIPAAIFDGTDIPRLTSVPPVKPIDSIEELIDVCARVIEDGSLVDDVERCIDGLARLVDSKPADLDRLATPLLKRIRKLIPKGCSPFCGIDPAHDIMGLFYAFCTGNVIEPRVNTGERRWLIEFEGHTHKAYSVNTMKPIGFLTAHCLAIAWRIAMGEALRLLSTPTHEGGWIDPRELAKRANAWTGSDPNSQDVILAMLRLAPDNRAAALKSLKDNSSEWFQAIRYAMGGENIKVGKEPAMWVAAARARAPWRDDETIMREHPGLGPDAAEAARLTFGFQVRTTSSRFDSGLTTEPALTETNDPLLVTVRMYTRRFVEEWLSFEMGGFAGRTTGAVRWTATIWPQARESYFAASALDCFDNLDWGQAQWQNRNMLEPLIDSGTPLRYAGLFLLTGMLAAKEPGESGLATDIAIRSIEDGRLGSDNFGNALATLFPTGLIKPGRWYKTLNDVARASPVHAAVVQIALQRCFTNPKQEPPKDSGKLLELLYELSLELGLAVTNSQCREWLSSGAVSGKSTKTAKNLLAIEDTPESKQAFRTILEQAIVQRTMAASCREGIQE